MNYEQKYLKYKYKYLKLKQIGGVKDNVTIVTKCKNNNGYKRTLEANRKMLVEKLNKYIKDENNSKLWDNYSIWNNDDKDNCNREPRWGYIFNALEKIKNNNRVKVDNFIFNIIDEIIKKDQYNEYNIHKANKTEKEEEENALNVMIKYG